MKKLSAIKLVKVGSLVITLAKGYKVKNKTKSWQIYHSAQKHKHVEKIKAKNRWDVFSSTYYLTSLPFCQLAVSSNT
jgi:hypothetical protein